MSYKPTQGEIVRKPNRQGQTRFFGPSLDGFDGTDRGFGYRSRGHYFRGLLGWRKLQHDRDAAELEEGLDRALEHDDWRTSK